MIKYAITGHTRGIGRRTYERLSPDIIGFSKSTGYDINKYIDRQRIIAESFDCDVFINNATEGFAQTYMLLDLVNAWGDNPNKTIINVGSRVAEIDVLPEHLKHLRYYQAEKLSIKHCSQRLAATSKCNMQYRWLTYVGTEAILAEYPHFKPGDYISEDEAVDIILS